MGMAFALYVAGLGSKSGPHMVPKALAGVIPEHSQERAPSTANCGPNSPPQIPQTEKQNRSLLDPQQISR